MFIYSTTSNLNNFKPQQLQPQQRVQNENKKQNRRSEFRNHIKDPPIAPLFRHYATFLKFFGLHQRVSPSFVSIFCNNGCQKIPKGPPFYIFRHCGTVQKSHFKNFWEIFSSPQSAPPHFFHILQPAGVSQSPKGPLFTILSLRYGADFGCSRLVSRRFSLENSRL